MMIYVGFTQAMEAVQEEQVEASILEWFQIHKHSLDLVGIFPYDPILREIAIDAGDQACRPVTDSLELWISRNLDLGDIEVILSNRSVLDGMSPSERAENTRQKLLYVNSTVRKLNRNLGSGKLRQVEYMLSGVIAEMNDILCPESPSNWGQPPLEDGFSRQMDDFWKTL